MRSSHQEPERSSFEWPLVRLPRIRIAVPSIIDGARRQKKMKKARGNAHGELLDQFRRDMDGFMPLPESRRTAKKR